VVPYYKKEKKKGIFGDRHKIKKRFMIRAVDLISNVTHQAM